LLTAIRLTPIWRARSAWDNWPACSNCPAVKRRSSPTGR